MKTVALTGLFRAPSLILCFALTSYAEPLLVSPQNTTPSPAAASEANAGTPGLGAKATFDSALPPNIPLARWGITSFRPHIAYQLMYATNLLNPQQIGSAASYVQTYSPGLLLEVGTHWVLDYTYSRVLFSNRSFPTESQQSTFVTGAYAFARWTVSGSANYSSGTSPLVETGRQTPQKTYGTEVAVRTLIGQHVELLSQADSVSRHVDQLPLDPQWTTSDWDSWKISETLQYHVTPRVEFGVGFIAGYDRVSAGPDMAHTEPTAEVTYRPTDKISVYARAGLETRTFKSGRNDRVHNPLYEASLEYAPMATTKLSIGGNRMYSASYFANWATRAEGWRLRLDQRLLQHLFFSAEYSQRHTNYVFTSAGKAFNRVDRGRSITTRLSTPFIGRGRISIFYEDGRNLANLQEFSSSGYQIGVELSYRF